MSGDSPNEMCGGARPPLIVGRKLKSKTIGPI
jgi:hypothetical protein